MALALVFAPGGFFRQTLTVGPVSASSTCLS